MTVSWESVANEHILGIAPYEPGKPIEELERAAERRRTHLQVTRGKFLGELRDAVAGHVEDQQFLLRGGADLA